MTEPTDRQKLAGLLEERGVEEADALVAELGDGANVDAMRNAISRADREGLSSTGLLVHRIKQAAVSRFRRPEDRVRVEGGGSAGEITPTLLKAIRGSCNSPNGFTREEARDMFAKKARRLGMDVDVLIDMAMGSDWRETRVHPALDAENPDKARDYERWVASS